MSGEVRTCVVGVGRLGREHARILQAHPQTKLVGVYDVDVERARTVGDPLGCPVFSELSPLLEVAQAAVIAVPTRAHAEIGLAALEAGCHVLVEKPLSRTLEEADRLLDAAKRAGVVLAVGHVERFNGVLIAAESWIDRPRFIESLRLAPYQPRGTDVTVILDLMIHDIDLVLGLVGSQPIDVRAVGVPVLSGSVDIANARLAFPGGTVATITASRASFKPVRQLRLFQHSGYASLDLGSGRGEFLRRKPDIDPDTATDLLSLVERIPLEGAPGEPLARELTAFLNAVSTRGTRLDPGLVSGRAARDALEVALDITGQIEEFVDVVAQDS